MMGWRARIGFLVPAGNPTVEPEMAELAPPGVSLHFNRLSAQGAAGTHAGREDRHRSQMNSLDEATRLLAMTLPQVIVLGHTATSYAIGREADAELVRHQEAATGTRFVTAFACVQQALTHLGIRRVAYATPYDAELTEQGRAHLQLHGFEVVAVARLQGVHNIYDETAERAYAIGRQADCPDAEAVFLSGTGMPTLAMIQALEDDLGKPVISANTAMMWNALRIAGVRNPRTGYGRLFHGG
jgi:maleate isomerase